MTIDDNGLAWLVDASADSAWIERYDRRPSLASICADSRRDQPQADAVIELLRPLVHAGTLMWEWADPLSVHG